MDTEIAFRDLTFIDAAHLWIELNSASVSPRTAAGYPGYAKRLSAYFAKTKLREIGIKQIREYQASESAVIAASTVNHQITFLSHILGEAGIWETIQPHYHPLKANPRQRPVLTEEEELRLFRTAMNSPYWKIAYLASLIVAATTLRPNQVRQLRLSDIDLPNNRLLIRAESTLIPVPLNDTAVWAIKELMERAKQLGAGLPEHDLIPHRARNRGRPIVTEPQGSWKRAWRRMCEAASLPDLQMFDLTHSSIVRILAERGAAAFGSQENGCLRETKYRFEKPRSRNCGWHSFAQSTQARNRGAGVFALSERRKNRRQVLWPMRRCAQRAPEMRILRNSCQHCC